MIIPRFNSTCGNYQLLSDEEIQNANHVVSFSGGRTSAYMLAKLLEVIPKERLIVNFANTGREDEATLEFVRDCENYFEVKINWLEFDLDENGKRVFKVVNFDTASRNGEPLYKAIKSYKYVPNIHKRGCTVLCKIDTMEKFFKSIGCEKHETIQYIGIRYDEPKRWSRYINQFDINSVIKVYPLIDWCVSKNDVLDFWAKMPFDLKLNELFGNCDLCFLKSTKKRIAVLKQKPEAANFWSNIEEEFGNKFDQNYSVKQLYKIATGKALLDETKCQINDIDCNCNVD